jgi:lipoyl(octanoyl) transferase
VRDWRLIIGAGSGPADPSDPTGAEAHGARNMAVDHALFEGVQAGGPPVLRLYRWRPACLSLGRNQHARMLYDEDRLRDAGLDVVRRPTGGLGVLHDDELTYCVLAPSGPLGGPRAAYQLINRAIIEGLGLLGVCAYAAAQAPAPDPRLDAAAPCFAAPGGGEVVAEGRKLVGSAQRCERRTLLQHGSLLLDGSQGRLLQLLVPATGAVPAVWQRGQPPGGGPAGAVTLRELLGSAPEWGALTAALCRGFEKMCGTRLAPGTLSAAESARAAELEALYGGAAWTWRK